MTILNAYDFIHEHLYEFCMDNQPYSPDSYQSDPEYKGQPSTKVKIDDLGLSKGQKFSLHYDFGDDWMFTILVQKITDVSVRPLPVVTKSVGAVEQYPDPDEDYGDEDWDDEELAEFDKSRKANRSYMDLFEGELKMAGLSEKTAGRHVENADFYLNDYLPHCDGATMEEGAGSGFLEDFFGYFYIRKCMWSTPGNLKTTAASIKKFYKCMYEHQLIAKEVWQELSETIKERTADWQEACRKYNDDDEWF